MIEIELERDIRTDTGTLKKKSISYTGEIIPLGDIRVSNNPEYTGINTIGLKSLGKNFGNKTILENALDFHYNDANTDKERKIRIQQCLVMLKDLGVELTPEENMAMLREKKQYLEKQLAEVNKELEQKESQQK